METVTQAVTQEGGAVSRCCWSSSLSHNNEQCKMLLEKEVGIGSRPSQLAKLSRSEFDPELFSQNAYDKFVVAFVTSAVFDILLQNETIFDIVNG